ncbi:MAG: PHP domain-containing protein [Roseburia sp.]|nr:PHP domain-containing protein [Lachnospiraceae bacterium]MCM1568883.1 PHP domain-containing protein [Roseburia sp.]
MPSCVDLHMHSATSDGTDTPIQLAEQMRAKGIHTFALTDHDTIRGVAQILHQIPGDLTFIPGIEFSCWMPSGKCHILGYSYNAAHPVFQAALEEGAARRHAKLDKRLAFLQERGIQFPHEELERLHRIPGVGKPHLGNLMVEYGYARTKEDAINNVLNLCHTGSSRIPAKTAVQAIVAAGGIPVWAHPLGGEGEPEVGRKQFETMLDELIEYGLAGMECFYSKYPLKRCEELAEIAQAHNLLVSGGSDYHGANKNIALGTLNAEDIEMHPERLTILSALF